MAARTPFNRITASLLIVLGLSTHISLASAAPVESAPTDSVMGRAPVVVPTIDNQDRPGQPPSDGETIVVTPVFSDEDGDTEMTTYVWKADGTVIPSQTMPTYVVQAADLGKTFTVEVTPATDPTITDPAVGTMVPVSITAAVTAANKPLSIAITKGGSAISGNPIVGDVLTAVPTCPATCDSNLVYTWTVDGTTVGDDGNTYTVTKDDQKKAIIVSVPDVKAVQRRR